MPNTVYRIKACLDGSWVVFEAGRFAALSTFEVKSDAVDYAFGLARSSRGGTVEIHDRHNNTESCGELAMGTGRSDDD